MTINAGIRESWPENSLWREWAQGEPPYFQGTHNGTVPETTGYTAL